MSCIVRGADTALPHSCLQGLAHSCPHYQGQLYCAAQASPGPAFPSAAAGEGQGHLIPVSWSQDQLSLLPEVVKGDVEEGIFFSPTAMLPHGRWVEGLAL